MSNLRRWSANGWTSAKGCTRGNYKRQSVNFSLVSDNEVESKKQPIRMSKPIRMRLSEIILAWTSHNLWWCTWKIIHDAKRQFILSLRKIKLTQFTGYMSVKMCDIKYWFRHYFCTLQNINDSDEFLFSKLHVSHADRDFSYLFLNLPKGRLNLNLNLSIELYVLFLYNMSQLSSCTICFIDRSRKAIEARLFCSY